MTARPSPLTVQVRPLTSTAVFGLRAFHSPTFRLSVGLALWLVGTVVLGALLLRQAADPAGQFAFDFGAYHAATTELAAGRSPYPAEMFAGPIPAQGAILYKYPPLFGQLLTPLAGLPLPAAAATWLVAQAAMIFGGVWLAARAGGASASASTAVWSAVAATYFLPCFDTLWKGNVSGALVLGVALVLRGGPAGGAGAAASALLKSTPAVLLMPAVAAGGRAWYGIAACLPIVGLSVVLSPAAWLDFVRLLPNLVGGPSLFANNLAPHSLLAFAVPALPAAAEVVRFVAVALGAVAAVASFRLGRYQTAWGAAVALAVAALLLLPSATWYHYLAVLLPLAAYSWPRG